MKIGASPARFSGSSGRRWLWILLSILLAAGIYTYVTDRDKAQQDVRQRPARKEQGALDTAPITPVVISTARVGDINVYLNGLGSVTPLSSVTVRTQVDGRLIKILFKEGQIVKRGELLAEVDPRPFQVQLMQAEGQMGRDQALLKNAKVDLKRYRTLFQQDSIARQQLDTQEALVSQYESAVKIDQGQIESARLQLTYARITAPIAGRIGLRQVDQGNVIHVNDANGLAVITQVQPAGVIFTLQEDNIPLVMQKLRAGLSFAVDAYDRALKTKLSSGSLLTVDNQIDPATGTVKAKAQFANEDFALFPNQFVNTRLLVDIKRSVTIIPTAGVQRGSQGTFVYLLKQDHTVAVRAVKTGVTQAEDTEIIAGLAPGEQVVVDGADKLREGAKVALAQNRDNARGQGDSGSWNAESAWQGAKNGASKDSCGESAGNSDMKR